TLLEIVLGIDNIVFIAILCGRLPEHQREKARKVGLALALVTRIALLATISLILSLATTPLFTVPFLTEPATHAATELAAGTVVERAPLTVSGKDLILIIGGLFLLWKAVHELHAKMEGGEEAGKGGKHAKFGAIIVQILLIDLVFSIDSVVTAVGMARELWIMVTAVVISVMIMMVFSGYIARFIDKHPTLKVLALSFLMLIGFVLIADGLGQHIPKGYVYFAMAFSLMTEVINIRMRVKSSLAKPL
ncbi:MAG: TerC family protein, partial [Planctomycetota bacterium]